MIDVTDKCMIIEETFIDKSIRRQGKITETYTKRFISIEMKRDHHNLLDEVVIIEGNKCFAISMNPFGAYIMEVVG